MTLTLLCNSSYDGYISCSVVSSAFSYSEFPFNRSSGSSVKLHSEVCFAFPVWLT